MMNENKNAIVEASIQSNTYYIIFTKYSLHEL